MEGQGTAIRWANKWAPWSLNFRDLIALPTCVMRASDRANEIRTDTDTRLRRVLLLLWVLAQDPGERRTVQKDSNQGCEDGPRRRVISRHLLIKKDQIGGEISLLKDGKGRRRELQGSLNWYREQWLVNGNGSSWHMAVPNYYLHMPRKLRAAVSSIGWRRKTRFIWI